MNSLPLAGSIGFWACSWATISFRKAFLPSSPFGFSGAPAELSLVPVLDVNACGEAMVMVWSSSRFVVGGPRRARRSGRRCLARVPAGTAARRWDPTADPRGSRRCFRSGVPLGSWLVALDEHVDQGAGAWRGCLRGLQLAGGIRLRILGALGGASAVRQAGGRAELAVCALTI